MSPANILEAVLRGLDTQSVTSFFIVVLLVTFVTAIIMERRGKNARLVQHAPNLLTSMGILGTFIGIVIGLLAFDATDIDSSIAPLLDGLKTAFITSLVGMLLAILFKFGDSLGIFAPPNVEEASPEAVTPDQVMASLLRQEKNLEKLTRAISGDEETTLASQIRLMRSEQGDHHRIRREEREKEREQFEQFQQRLWDQLQEFAEMMSKSATEQVIEALNQVIADFNRNLTEQFGENFKRLDASVEKLVVWQDNYKGQVEQMGEQYAEGVKAIGHTRELVHAIQEDTSKIPHTMESLNDLLETSQHQLAELERHLEAFRDMRDRAVEAVPQIKTQVDAIVEDVSNAARESGQRISSVTENMEQALITGFEDFQNNVSRTNEGLVSASDTLATSSMEISGQLNTSISEINERMRDLVMRIDGGAKKIQKTLSDSNQELETQVRTVHQAVADSIDKMRNRIEATLDEVSKQHVNAASRSSEAIAQELQKSTQRTGEAINRQLDAMDQQMQQELTRVMSEMGSALAQISNQFTNDYRKLTEQMQQVVGRTRAV